MMRRAKKIDDEVDKKLAIFDSTKHWRDKKLDDMTRRDWRILREDFDIRIRKERHRIRFATGTSLRSLRAF